MRTVLPLAVIALLVLVSCGAVEESPQVDLEAERTALMEADRAWSQSVSDVESFMSFFAEGAYFLPPGMPLAQGQEAIRDTATKIFSTPGLNLTWNATHADLAESGDLGYTVGSYRLTANDEEGNPATIAGKYVTVWKKQADGRWKVVADCFNPDGPAAAEA